MEIRQRVSDIVVEDGWALLKLVRVQDRPGVAGRIFSSIAEAGISVDLILQNASVHRYTDVSFSVRQADLGPALDVVRSLEGDVGAGGVEALERLAKVEIVGTGILSDSSHVGLLFSSLAAAKVNILVIGTSEVRISCLIHGKDRTRARKALYAAFKVEGQPAHPA